MSSKVGYLTVSIGSVITYGGMLQLITMSSGSSVLTWSVVTLVGILVLAGGVKKILLEIDKKKRPEPEKAPGKTDSPYGRR